MAETIEEEKSFEEEYKLPTWIEVHWATESAITISALLPDNYLDLRCRIQANTFALVEQVTDEANLVSFLEAFDNAITSTDEVGHGNEDLVPMAQKLDDVYKNFLGEKWISNTSEELAKAVTFTKDGEVVAVNIVSPNNFYFNPPEELFYEDTFPYKGQILPEGPKNGRLGKNLSVFNPNGVKVFWGDLSFAQAKKLKGTYYILGERDSYHDVPDYAVVVDSGELADDPKRPAGALVHLMPSDKTELDISYIKVKATHAVVGGKVVANKIKIEKPRQPDS
jgi:hypothetical protein